MAAVTAGAFKLLWLLFILLSIKDWLLSAVNPYPYAASLVVTIGLAGASWLIMARRRTRGAASTVLGLMAIGFAFARSEPGPFEIGPMSIAALALTLAGLAWARRPMERVGFGLAAALTVVIGVHFYQADGQAEAWAAASVLVTIAVGRLLARTTTHTHLAPLSPGKNMSMKHWARLVLSVLLIGQSTALLAVFASDVCETSWTDVTILGMGLGSSHVSTTTLIPSQTNVTPIPGNTPADIVVAEQGLLLFAALCLLVLATSVAACVVLLRAEPTPNSSLKEGVSESSPTKDAHHSSLFTLHSQLSAGGLAGLNGLLALACSTPAFLTGNTAFGTYALSLCIGCVGAAIANGLPAAEAAAGNAVDVQERPSYKMRALGWRWISLVLVLMASGLVVHVDNGMRNRVLPLAGIGPRAGTVSAADFTMLSAISQPMRDATVAMEDHNFYQHHGLDWVAIHHALRLDLRSGEIKEGGSTITEQLAKNLFLSSDRTLPRKIEEAFLAVEMERRLSKQRILELYLNTIDYGMGQHGVAQSARYYFHTTPRQLTLAESAILVGMVPDPMHEAIDPSRVWEGEQTAIGRTAFFFPLRYSQTDADMASAIALDRIMYPFKDAWDRGATQDIPAIWHGVSFYYFVDPDEPTPVDNVAQCLKDHMAGFLVAAYSHYHIVGIDHLGAYSDRPMRQSQTVLSAHAFGQAIDISGFRFADGARIMVVDHDKPSVASRLAPIEALLKKHFDIVVDWEDDPLRHQTHFHCEVKGSRHVRT